MNDLFIRACRMQKTDYTPIWLMRQAGRYMPEYRKLRERHSIMEIYKTPELSAQVAARGERRPAVVPTRPCASRRVSITSAESAGSMTVNSGGSANASA